MIKILEQKDNFLLKRKEIKMIVESGKNPSYDESLVLVSKETKAEPEKIVIKAVRGKFGRETFLISAYIYNSAEDKIKFEPKPKVAKSATPGA